MRRLLLLLALLPACGGLSAKLEPGVDAPRELAILPFAGDSPLADREVVRSMLRERLVVRYVPVLENAWVDRVLSEHGWLSDPETFDPKKVPLAEACAALGTQGLVIGTGIGTSTFDALVFFRTGMGGKLEWITRDAKPYFTAEYTATRTGGVLLKSGQLIAAITEHVENGTSQGFVKLVEEYLDTVLTALPEVPAEGRPERARPTLHAARVVGRDGDVVHLAVTGTPGATVAFDVVPAIANVPSVELRPGEYHARMKGLPDGQIRVRARDALGREASAEVNR